MRDQSHDVFLEHWADFVKNNPPSVWKKQVTELIDSQFMISDRFYENLSKTPEGRKTIEKLKKEWATKQAIF